jgi:hypothetical protein
MATETVTFVHQHPVGNMREDIGDFTASDTTGDVQTRLTWIYQVEMRSPDGGGDNVQVHKNSQSDAEDDITLGGWFHFIAATGSDNYRYRAIGR